LMLCAPALAYAQDEPTPADEAPVDGTTPAEPAPVPLEDLPVEEPAAAPATSGNVAVSATSTSTAASASTSAEAAAEEAPATRRPATSRGGGPSGGDKWEFSYSGYFRAPLRLGISDN